MKWINGSGFFSAIEVELFKNQGLQMFKKIIL